jgi:hypothetical protein
MFLGAFSIYYDIERNKGIFFPEIQGNGKTGQRHYTGR